MGLPETLLDVLEGGDPKSPALLCSGGAELSRFQLKEQCVILAEAVRNAGIKPGDAVSIADTNTVSPMPFIIFMICQLKQMLLKICTKLYLTIQNHYYAAGGICDCIHRRHTRTRCCCSIESKLHRGECKMLDF